MGKVALATLRNFGLGSMVPAGRKFALLSKSPHKWKLYFPERASMPDIAATRPATDEPVDTAWGQQIHDAVEGIQTGKVSMVGLNNSTVINVVVTFPRAYTVAPHVVCVTASPACIAGAVGVTTTGFTLAGYRLQTGGSTTQDAYWIANGTPA